jgi:hypothetical protein
MKVAGFALGGLMVLFGGLWMGQGLGYIGGGFMVGDIKWTYIGAVLAALGIGLILRTRRRSV